MRETRSGLAGVRQPVCFPLVPGAGMCRGAGCITVGQVSACVVGANAGPGKWFSGMSAGYAGGWCGCGSGHAGSLPLYRFCHEVPGVRHRWLQRVPRRKAGGQVRAQTGPVLPAGRRA